MNAITYICNAVVGLLGGGLAGGAGGLLLGWLMALGHHRQGHLDDGPVYVTIGLAYLGAFLGAVVGLVRGIVVSVKLTRKRVMNQSA